MKYLFYILTVAYMGLIFYLSHQSNVFPDVNMDFGIDKVFHCIEFGGLAFLSLLSCYFTVPILNKRHCYYVIALGIIYAASDEIHQSYIPNRRASIEDVFADSIGVIVVTIVLFCLLKMYDAKTSKHESQGA